MRTATVALALLSALPAFGVYGDDRGDRPEELNACDEHFDRGRRAEANSCYTGLLQSPNSAIRAEAWWALGNVKRANEVFRDLVKTEADKPDYRVRWGYLFLQTHQEGEAHKLFTEALEMDEDHVPAKIGLATVMAGRFEEKAKKLIEETLEVKPEQVVAHLMLAKMALEDGEIEAAQKSTDAALEQAEKLERSPLEVYTYKAAADLLRGVTESDWTKKALEYNPNYGRIYSDVAHFYIITRRYREAIALYEKAVALDPQLWSAHADLGVNLMRENLEERGRAHLETAFKGDPFSAKTVNSLRLIDSFKNFRLYSSKDLLALQGETRILDALEEAPIMVRLHKDEAQLMRPYVMELAERSAKEFGEKYKFKPTRPIHVELYSNHDDFAVRTMGMPGIGLLGVTFGYMVAMDSPGAREAGTYHWGTTLWHEMAHVFTLEATNHLVPRWYSEGISMYEEWEARPDWGERISPDFVAAFEEGKLLPVADMDKGFIRPSYPNQIAVSYFQSGLTCQFIDREWGFERLVEMLHNFSGQITTAQNIERVLGVKPAEFDELFQEFLTKRLGKLAEEGVKGWRAKLKESLAAAREEKWEELIDLANEAKAIYPEYVETGTPYTLLSKAYDELDRREEAIEELVAYRKIGGRQPETLKKLAGWLTEAGRRTEAIETLEALIYIWPADEQLHADLGEYLLAEDRVQEAAREFEALLAMGPHDKAAAHFRVAQAYHRLEDSQKARRHVLLALEVAPSYTPALKLLVEIAR